MPLAVSDGYASIATCIRKFTMYQSKLHRVILDSTEKTIWTRSTKDEDNYRQVLCASIYEHVSPNNVEIPSTRSAKGDINIFDRRLELKYASNEKVEGLNSILADFDDLLDGKIHFSLIVLRTDTSRLDTHVNHLIHFPKLAKQGALADFHIHPHSAQNYSGVSLFLPISHVHPPVSIHMKTGKGNQATAYLSFEKSHNIVRSSFFRIGTKLFHADAIGSHEDGLIALLFKAAADVELVSINATQFTIDIPYQPVALTLASGELVDVYPKDRKGITDAQPPADRKPIETRVPVFTV